MMGESGEINPQTPNKKKKKNRWMIDFLFHTVDRFFYQVYDGEAVGGPVKRLSSTENILEEEVLFCKNNVCVHSVSNDDENYGEKHLPGYLNIKKVFRADNEVSDLMLNWTPNTLLTVGTTEKAEILSSLEVHNENNISEISGSNDEKTSDVQLSSGDLSPTLCDFETPLGKVFSINIIDVKTLKLFYSDSTSDCGQFVIGSHENEYKVFHFHNGGLSKVAEIFDQWNGCIVDNDLNIHDDGQQVFYVHTKSSAEDGRELHQEEGRYKPMNMSRWYSSINQLGQIEDGYNFRKHVFFGGLSQEVRPDAWKFLLYYYPMQSTVKDRELIREQKRKIYEKINEKRVSFSAEEYELFWKKVQFTVDKDVVRTDRSHPYYAGQQNPNLDKMRNILLNYAVYNPDMGYTQGMSDLVAPVIATLHDESDSFWCFVGLMEFSMFATTPTDKSMDRSLGYLRELLRILLPDFYMHCLCSDYELNLLFAHRWLVLCFKREFIFHEVLKIWETCWARYQTDYFHIFICVAIVSLYGTVCLDKKMDSIEILQYFTDMATKFDGSAVLKEGRSLLYKFRQLNRVPCSLRGLLNGKGVWDGGISPEIECVTNHQHCCFENEKLNIDTSHDNPVNENSSPLTEMQNLSCTSHSSVCVENRLCDSSDGVEDEKGNKGGNNSFQKDDIAIENGEMEQEKCSGKVFHEEEKQEAETFLCNDIENTSLSSETERSKCVSNESELSDVLVEKSSIDLPHELCDDSISSSEKRSVDISKEDLDAVNHMADLSLNNENLPDKNFPNATIY